MSILYAAEYVRDTELVVERFSELVPKADSAPEAMRFAQALLTGVLVRRETLDEKIQASSPRWKLGRMAAIDRNILRLGTYELLHCAVPPRVVLNEAIELAKLFGAEQTRNFVNGILQQVCTDNGIDLE